MKMTVGDLIDKLEQYQSHREVVLEAGGLGEQDTSEIYDIQEAYTGQIHIIAADGIKDKHG